MIYIRYNNLGLQGQIKHADAEGTQKLHVNTNGALDFLQNKWKKFLVLAIVCKKLVSCTHSLHIKGKIRLRIVRNYLILIT